VGRVVVSPEHRDCELPASRDDQAQRRRMLSDWVAPTLAFSSLSSADARGGFALRLPSCAVPNLFQSLVRLSRDKLPPRFLEKCSSDLILSPADGLFLLLPLAPLAPSHAFVACHYDVTHPRLQAPPYHTLAALHSSPTLAVVLLVYQRPLDLQRQRYDASTPNTQDTTDSFQSTRCLPST